MVVINPLDLRRSFDEAAEFINGEYFS